MDLHNFTRAVPPGCFDTGQLLACKRLVVLLLLEAEVEVEEAVGPGSGKRSLSAINWI